MNSSIRLFSRSLLGLITALSVLASLGCLGFRSGPMREPPTASTTPQTQESVGEEPGESEAIARFIWRGERLDRFAFERLADRAVLLATGERYPLDGWAVIAGQGPLSIVAMPAAGPLAEVVRSRLERVAADPAMIEIVSSIPEPGVRTLWIMAPDWADDALTPALDDGEAWGSGRQAPVELHIVDLGSPVIDGQPWAAGELALVTSPRAAKLLAAYVLSSRASGELAQVETLAAELGFNAQDIEWILEVVRD